MEPVLNILSYVFWVLVALTILVFVHELGHFLFAKLFKMRVDRFSIGFPPKLVGKKIGETEYMIGATPMGGYVKIAGMVDESMDTEFAGEEPQPWEFRAKPVWQRIIVITAGVIFNIILAIVIFSTLKMSYGEDYIPAENIESVYVADSSVAYDMGVRTGDRIVAASGHHLERFSDLDNIGALMADPFTITVKRNGEELTFEGPRDIMTQLQREGLGISAFPSLVGGVLKGSAANRAGLQPGDRIVSIAGQPVRFWAELTRKIQQSKGQPVEIQWERPDSLSEPNLASNGTAVSIERDTLAGVQIMQATVAPTTNPEGDGYQLGIQGPGEDLLSAEWGVRHKDYGFFEAIGSGTKDAWVNTAAIATSLKRIFTGREDFRQNVGGLVAIAQVTKQAADAGAAVFWNIVALLSISLAIMNILPIPALDGGHLVFLIYEGVTRREPSLRVRMALQQIGMIVLLAFMTFLIFNDILKL